MITVYLTAYLIGLLVTTIGALQAAWSLSPNTVPVAAFAGLVWPLLLVGVAELGVFVTLARAMRRSDSDARSYG